MPPIDPFVRFEQRSAPYNVRRVFSTYVAHTICTIWLMISLLRAAEIVQSSNAERFSMLANDEMHAKKLLLTRASSKPNGEFSGYTAVRTATRCILDQTQRVSISIAEQPRRYPVQHYHLSSPFLASAPTALLCSIERASLFESLESEKFRDSIFYCSVSILSLLS